jgi:hypothetical protein
METALYNLCMVNDFTSISDAAKAPQSEGRFRGLLVVLLQRFGHAISLRAIINLAGGCRV